MQNAMKIYYKGIQSSVGGKKGPEFTFGHIGLACLEIRYLDLRIRYGLKK